MKKTFKLIILVLPIIFINSVQAKYAHEEFLITDKNAQNIKLLKSRPEFTIDHVHEDGFELFGPKKTEEFLIRNKISFKKKPPLENFLKDQYPTPEDIENKLKSLAHKFPQLSSLYSIGKSVKNRNLWVMKITAPNNKVKPKFKYVANMHGDEIVGREIMVLFIKDLLENFNVDTSITKLLESTEIHIMPSMNPDGAALSRRGNANYVDLNRDFPDFTTNDNQDTTTNRQPETQAIMNWQNQHFFKLSANFHGGAEVVNYPWDTTPTEVPNFAFIKDISLEYATNATYMANSTTFQNGIVNGFEWYEINGGMQDWSIHWRKDTQVTIELSDDKWPSYSTISYYYQENRQSLIRFIERIHTF